MYIFAFVCTNTYRSYDVHYRTVNSHADNWTSLNVYLELIMLWTLAAIC